MKPLASIQRFRLIPHMIAFLEVLKFSVCAKGGGMGRDLITDVISKTEANIGSSMVSTPTNVMILNILVPPLIPLDHSCEKLQISS